MRSPTQRFAHAVGLSLVPMFVFAQVDKTTEITNTATAGETCYVDAVATTYCAQVGALQYINTYPFLEQVQIYERYYTQNFEEFGDRALVCPLPKGSLTVTNRSALLQIAQDSASPLCSNYGSYTLPDGSSGAWSFSGTVVVRVDWVNPIDHVYGLSTVSIFSETKDPGEVKRLTCEDRTGYGSRGSISINEKAYPLIDFSTFGTFTKRTCKRVTNSQP